MNFFGAKRPEKLCVGVEENRDKECKKQIAVWEKASAQNLIGLCAIRTGSMQYDNGVKDGSYMEEGIWIKEVSPHGHILYRSWIGDSNSVLRPKWNDDQWARAPDSFCERIKGFKTDLTALVKEEEGKKEKNKMR